MLNQVVLMGRLTRDPELRHTQSGTAVASFSLAVERDFKSTDGQRQTDFIDIVAWRSTAEFVSRYFTKGLLVAVTGRLQIRDWTDNNGNKRRSAEIVAEQVHFAEGKKSREDGGSFSPAYSDNDAPPSGGFGKVESSDFAELNDDDGELPF